MIESEGLVSYSLNDSLLNIEITTFGNDQGTLGSRIDWNDAAIGD